MYANRPVLSSQGIALSNLLERTNNRKLVGFFLPDDYFDDYFYNRQIRTVEQKKRFFAEFIPSFQKEIAEQPRNIDTLFITSEHFHSRLIDQKSIDQLHAFLSNLFSKITVVCYFREQSQVVKSLYSTHIKVGWREGYSTFQKKAKPDNPYYNYELFFDKWSNSFGKQNLVARIFDRKNFVEGDIRKDILNIIKPEIDFDKFDYSIANSNESLGLLGLEIGRRVNAILPRYDSEGRLNKLREQIFSLLQESSLSQLHSLSNDNAQKIYADFSEINERFAKKYLDLNHNPFSKPNSEGSRGDVNTDEMQVRFGDALELLESIFKLINQIPLLHNDDIKTVKNVSSALKNHRPISSADTKRFIKMAESVKLSHLSSRPK